MRIVVHIVCHTIVQVSARSIAVISQRGSGALVPEVQSCCTVMLSRSLGEMDVDSGQSLMDTGESSSNGSDGKRFLEQAARVMDLKKVVQPPSFDSKVEHWADYKFRMMSIFALLDLTDAVNASLEVGEEHLKMVSIGPSMKVKSQLVYAMLVSGTSGKAQAMLRLVEPGEGFLAWCRITRELEPNSNGIDGQKFLEQIAQETSGHQYRSNLALTLS